MGRTRLCCFLWGHASLFHHCQESLDVYLNDAPVIIVLWKEYSTVQENQRIMKKQKLADFFYGLTTFLALLLVVESIYDGLEAWRIALNCLLFVFCADGLIVRKLEQRKKNKDN